MRSVVVAKFVPWPPNSGDKRRTYALVRALATLGPVTVCAFAGPDEDVDGLVQQGIDVRWVPRATGVRNFVHGLVTTSSVTGARFWSSELARVVAQAVREPTDVIQVAHVQLLSYAPKGAQAQLVVDMHNIESSLTARYARSQRGLRRLALHLESRLLGRLERGASRRADIVSVVSVLDEKCLRAFAAPAQLVVVPNAWDAVTPLPAAAEPVVAFVSLMSWAPNVDAAVWFTTQVWPEVLVRVPDATLLLVGRSPSPAVLSLAGGSVAVTGTVADVEPYYARARVAVAPLRSGGGSRLKILEALAFGRPVVATTVGAEGLEDLVGRGVVVEDEVVATADAIASLLWNPEAATELGLRGARAVDEDHTWGSATRPLLRVIEAHGSTHDRTA